MADYSITAANVAKVSGDSETITAGEALTAGQAVYVNASDGKIYKADANATGKDAAVGIALNAASAGQPVTVQKTGSITFGGSGAVGDIVCLSATAGGMCPSGDLTTGDKVTPIGVLLTATSLVILLGGPYSSGATKP